MRSPLGVLVVLALSLAGAGLAHAAAVNIAPTRAVLDARSASAAFTLFNDDPVEAVTYRISLVDRVMTEDGSVRELAEGAPMPAGLKSAMPYLRISPAQVRLGPKQSQVIRVAFRPPADLARGEYRAHLMVVALPKPPQVGGEAPQTGLSINLLSAYAATVPVIVRVGGASAAPSLDGLRFVPGAGARGPALSFDLARHGDASVAGDIVVYYQAPGGGKPVEVGQIRKIATYTEIPSRRVLIALKKPPGGDFTSGGRFVARMYADLDVRGMPLTDAEASIP